MFSFKKLSSWSLVAVIATVVALISAVHLFLSPGGPSLDEFGARPVEILQNSSILVNVSREEGKSSIPDNRSNGGTKVVVSKKLNGSVEQDMVNKNQAKWTMVDLSVQYPADSRNAVVYRGAPWKAEIGRWLSGCYSNIVAVKIVEVPNIYGCQGCLQLSSFSDNGNRI